MKEGRHGAVAFAVSGLALPGAVTPVASDRGRLAPAPSDPA